MPQALTKPHPEKTNGKETFSYIPKIQGFP